MTTDKRERDEPLSGLFAINKPTGCISMKILEQLKPLLGSSSLFAQPDEKETAQRPRKRRRVAKGRLDQDNRVKLGQGGTLDPLATGVLGTKALQSYLTGPKEYRVVGVLGAATDSLDAEGRITYTAPWRHVTQRTIEEALPQFRGDIMQTPPAYSAIQIDGKRLYDYARSGTSLPRPVEARKCHISSLELEAFYMPADHSYLLPTQRLAKADAEVHRQLVTMLGKPMPELNDASDEPISNKTSAFALKMTVSGGTYVRTVVDDLARSIGSAAYVAKLERTKQGPFEIKDCLDWDIFQNASATEKATDQRAIWEQAIVDKLVRV